MVTLFVGDKMYFDAFKTYLSSYNPFQRTGGTTNSRYCYSVWLRHLMLLKSNNPNYQIPQVIAELGPGDSIGIGLAGLISGVNQYYALDIVKYADNKINLKIFDELVKLFNERAKIPSDNEFPSLKPSLDSYEFPENIFNENYLDKILNRDRLDDIRNSISLNDPNSKNEQKIIYAVPWTKYNLSLSNSIDLIYSQAVLEHVDELEDIYQSMHEWLKPGGFMSHQIDFKCHGTAREWNGHWKYPDYLWNFIKGKRAYLINREPYSTHIKLLKENNFEIIDIQKRKDSNGLRKDQLNDKFKFLTDEDMATPSAYIQAAKRVTNAI